MFIASAPDLIKYVEYNFTFQSSFFTSIDFYRRRVNTSTRIWNFRKFNPNVGAFQLIANRQFYFNAQENSRGGAFGFSISQRGRKKWGSSSSLSLPKSQCNKKSILLLLLSLAKTFSNSSPLDQCHPRKNYCYCHILSFDIK